MPTLRLDVEALRRLPDDSQRHELFDGEHIVTPSPAPAHQRVLLRLASRLERFVVRHQLGEVFIAPLDVLLSPYDLLQPDLFFLRRERLHLVTPQGIRGAPDLVAEILSPSTRALDRGPRLAAYDRLGVGEVWLVDLDARQVAVHRRDSMRLTLVATLPTPRHKALRSPQLPGLRLPVLALFND